MEQRKGWAGNEAPPLRAITTPLVLRLGRQRGMQSKQTEEFGLPKEKGNSDSASNKSNAPDPKMSREVASSPPPLLSDPGLHAQPTAQAHTQRLTGFYEVKCKTKSLGSDRQKDLCHSLFPYIRLENIPNLLRSEFCFPGKIRVSFSSVCGLRGSRHNWGAVCGRRTCGARGAGAGCGRGPGAAGATWSPRGSPAPARAESLWPIPQVQEYGRKQTPWHRTTAVSALNTMALGTRQSFVEEVTWRSKNILN